jgi:ABC-type nitrate/sulfonate/bicarbonate transport system substrate-binding protein
VGPHENIVNNYQEEHDGRRQPMCKKVCALFVVVLLVCSAMSAAAQEKKGLEPLKLVLFTQRSPLVVGQAKGFFAEEGIRLDITLTRNSVEQIRGILAGTWDLAQTATDNVIAYVESEGVDLAVFAGEERGLNISLFVQPGIKSVKDLKGKVLGVDAVATGFTFILRKMLILNGLDLNRKDYELVAVGGTAQRLQALKEGKVAGTLLNMPYDDMAKQQGFVPLVAAKDVVDTFLASTWVGRRAWAAKNPDLLVRFIRAYIKSVDWLSNPSNKKEAVAIMAKEQKVSDEVAAKRLAQEVNPATGVVPRAAIDVKGIEAVMQLRAEAGLLKMPLPPAEKYYDVTYYNRAVQK